VCTESQNIKVSLRAQRGNRPRTILFRYHSEAIAALRSQGQTILQAWVYRFAFEGEHAEYALVHQAQRLAGHEAFEALDPKGEFAQG
jgi:hypothetical protein